MRKIGPLNKNELKEYQGRNGGQMDGIFGNQSMGIAIGIESDRDYYRAVCKALKDRPKPNPLAFGMVCAAMGALIAIALQVMFLA